MKNLHSVRYWRVLCQIFYKKGVSSSFKVRTTIQDTAFNQVMKYFLEQFYDRRKFQTSHLSLTFGSVVRIIISATRKHGIISTHSLKVAKIAVLWRAQRDHREDASVSPPPENGRTWANLLARPSKHRDSS